jgi:flavin-dependent dehydrogenase
MHYSLDARSTRRQKFGGPRWVAIGDAAFTHDPLSGQGVLFGVRSAEMAASAVFSLLKKGEESSFTAFLNWCEAQWLKQRATRASVYSKVLPSFRPKLFWSRRLV